MNQRILTWIKPSPAGLRAGNKKAQPPGEIGLFHFRNLTMTYFRMGNPYYHRRGSVSRPCSGWEGVGPERYARQEFGGSVPVQGFSLEAVTDRILEEVKVL